MKWPRFAFEKFAGADARLTTHMKSVGEAMAIGRTFQQAFAKAMRSRELDAPARLDGVGAEALLEAVERPTPRPLRRAAGVASAAARRSMHVHARTSIDPWFLRELRALALDPEAAFAGERSFKAVDTCAAEFEARTPYFYSGWERAAGPRGRALATGRAS